MFLTQAPLHAAAVRDAVAATYAERPRRSSLDSLIGSFAMSLAPATTQQYARVWEHFEAAMRERQTSVVGPD
eukprot:54496-Chlamydomonas_euryale.AAC.2